LRFIDASQPRFTGLALILDIPLVYFVFSVIVHAGNLPPRGAALQVQEIRLVRPICHFEQSGKSFFWFTPKAE
jgi:hypothetical protein